MIKHVVNDEAGTSTAANFTMSVTGSSPSPAASPGAEAPGTQVLIHPGAYSVSETGPAGYTGAFSAGCNGSIALGETKTCTVTNSDNDTPSSILVTKTADPTSLPEPGGSASFSVTVKNTSAVDSVTITSLTDDVYGDLDGKGTCDVPQTIAAGATYSCSFTGAVSGNAGSLTHGRRHARPAPTTTATRSRATMTRRDDHELASSILVTKSAIRPRCRSRAGTPPSTSRSRTRRLSTR